MDTWDPADELSVSPEVAAAGRLAHARTAVELLLSQDADRAMKRAVELELLNDKRRMLGRQVETEAQPIASGEYIGNLECTARSARIGASARQGGAGVCLSAYAWATRCISYRFLARPWWAGKSGYGAPPRSSEIAAVGAAAGT